MSDSENIKHISQAIGDIASDAVSISKVYTYPVWDFGRNLPCITSIYAGLASDPSVLGVGDLVVYAFELSLYYPFEGRAVQEQWTTVTNIVNDVIKVFREDMSLRGTALTSKMVNGEPIIEVPKGPAMKPRWLGHTFRIEAEVQEL